MRLPHLTKAVIVAMTAALLTGVALICTNIQAETVRNGEEYCDTFLDGQVIEQEIYLQHTPRIYVSLLPQYALPNDDVGIQYMLEMEEQKHTGFLPLKDYLNQQWTSLVVPTKDMKFVGFATLTLKAVGLDENNYIQFLVATNTLQSDPDLLLKKDSQIISNGRLAMSYKAMNFVGIAPTMTIVFLLVITLCCFVKPVLSNFRKYPLVYIVVSFFILNIIAQFSALKNINLHVSAQYLFSWIDLGFVRRALVGTLIDLLHIDFNVNTYIIFGILCIALMLVLELLILYDRRDLKYRNEIQKSFVLFLCTPFALTSFFTFHFFARFDELLIIAFLLCCITIIKERGIFLIPIISVLAILTHEMYLAMFIPFIFCLLLFKWYLTRQNKYLRCLIISSIASVGFGIYIGFFAKAAIPYDIAWSKIQTKGSPSLIWDYPLQVDYFTDSFETIRYSWNTIYQAKTIPITILSLFIMLPIIMIATVWLKRYFYQQNDRLGQMLVLLFPCTTLGLIVSMYSMCDWGRLFVMFGVGIYFSFVTLWSMDSECVQQSVKIVQEQTREKFGKWLFSGLCILYLFASTFSGGASSTSLFEFIHKIF